MHTRSLKVPLSLLAVSGAVVLLGGSSVLAAGKSESQLAYDHVQQALLASQEALPAAEQALITSTAPATIVIDPATDQILSVTAGEHATPAISINYICSSTDECWKTNQVPYADVGFYGSPGTYTGDWPYRKAFLTGEYYGSACFLFDGASGCTPEYAPNKTLTFSSDVTGTSATIYGT